MNELNAAWSEETIGSGDDNAVPTRGYQMLPTVGLGGSAGSIPALQAFLKKLPPDTGMAYVVVVHLSPEHESSLAEVLQKSTSMPVVQLTRAEKIEADHVYVIPPGRALRMGEGTIGLADLPQDRSRHVVVDLFFRSLAEWYGPHAIAIVLSGADGDGAIGIKRIKERGGLTLAQDPGEAEVGSMPRAAINTGMVDWVLPVAEMPERLVRYQRLEQQLKLPREDGPVPVETARHVDDADETGLRDVLAFLRKRTGRDFSYYKRATIVRRIARRMQVNAVDDLAGYLNCLRTQPGEAGALLQDLLISVTNFFRDAQSFAALQRYIPNLFKGKGVTDRVRVWVAACASGEEAYSIAMMLHEYADTLEEAPLIQVFATDLDENAIVIGRNGIYPSSIEADVSPERLRRFFMREHAGYRVRRELRETVLFALHDLLKDSPFSHLDMVACRNLMIYLSREAQVRLLHTFNFALQPDGLLFLGSSETVEEGSPLFGVLDKKHRIYGHRGAARAPLPLPMGVGVGALSAPVAPQAKGSEILSVPGRGPTCLR